MTIVLTATPLQIRNILSAGSWAWYRNSPLSLKVISVALHILWSRDYSVFLKSYSFRINLYTYS